jgi:hypothetical protein
MPTPNPLLDDAIRGILTSRVSHAEMGRRYGRSHQAIMQIRYGRAAIVQPEPVGPTDEELHQLWLDLYAFHEGPTSGDVAEIARAVLARWGRLPVT